VKSYCAADKLLRSTFAKCSTAVKKLYSVPIAYANVCLLTVKQIQTSMKHMQVAYNNAYRIMHYIPRNIKSLLLLVVLHLWWGILSLLFISVLYIVFINMQVYYHVSCLFA